MVSIKDLQKRKNELKSQLNSIDADIEKETLSQMSKFVGKYYLKNESDKPNFFRCFYVYGFSEKIKELNTLLIEYYTDNDIYFEINGNIYFNPDNIKEYGYVEISKEEFQKHYSQIENRLKRLIP